MIVVFAGEYDLACQKELRREFDRLHEQPNVVLDFSNVTYLDSTCIAELLILNKARKERGFTVETVVMPPGARIARLLDVAGLTKVFNVVDSLDGQLNRKDSEIRHVFSNLRD